MFRESFLHASFTESTVEVFALTDRIQVGTVMLNLISSPKMREIVFFFSKYFQDFELPEYYSSNRFVEPIQLLLLPPNCIGSDLL